MYKKLREKILGEEIISLPHTAVIKWIETEVETSWKCSLNDKFDQFIDISIKETFESSLGLQVLVDKSAVVYNMLERRNWIFVWYTIACIPTKLNLWYVLWSHVFMTHNRFW